MYVKLHGRSHPDSNSFNGSKTLGINGRRGPGLVKRFQGSRRKVSKVEGVQGYPKAKGPRDEGSFRAPMSKG